MARNKLLTQIQKDVQEELRTKCDCVQKEKVEVVQSSDVVAPRTPPWMSSGQVQLEGDLGKTHNTFEG